MSHSSGDVPRLGSGGLSEDAEGERSADLIAVYSETAMRYCRQDGSEHRPKNSKVHQKEHACMCECVCVCAEVPKFTPATLAHFEAVFPMPFRG